MPTHDPSLLVNQPDRTQDRTWPPACTAVTLTEVATRTHHGQVLHGIEVGWSHIPGRLPTSFFLIVIRHEDEQSWQQVGRVTARERTATIYPPLVVGETYEVDVIAVGVRCCAIRPAGISGSHAWITIEGHDQLPPQPRNLVANLKGAAAWLEWDPVEYSGVVTYEVAIGAATDELAVVLATTQTNRIELRNLPPLALSSVTGVYLHVRAVSASGLHGHSARVAADALEWGDAGMLGTTYQAATAWTGVHDGTEVESEHLIVSSGNQSGVWTSATHDAGEIADWTVLGVVAATKTNHALTFDSIGDLRFTDPLATTLQALDDVVPRSSVPGPTLERHSLLDGTFAASSPLTFESFENHERRHNEPTFEDLASFTFDGRAALSITADEGWVSGAGTGYSAEVRSSTDGSTWSAWVPLANQVVNARYFQFRVTITQPSWALEVRVERLVAMLVRHAWHGGWVEAETPTGAINGVNDTYSLSQTPVNPTGVHLVADGLALRYGTDFTISGSTLTYVSPLTGGSWHRIWFRY